MSTAVCLLLYAAVVAVVAPRLLPRVTHRGGAPALAVTAWLAVVASVVASWIAAALSIVAQVARTWNRPDAAVLMACLARVRSVALGHGGVALQLGFLSAAALMAAFVLTFLVRIGRTLRAGRTQSRRHAESARIIGRHIRGVDGFVIDAPQKMAYCVGGRGGTVVITSAAIAALEPAHLAAVLAHEQAHLTGRHHVVLAATAALTNSMPRVRLFQVAHTEIARLLEMCADDRAARRHGGGALVAAIMSLAGPASIPIAALGASSVGVSARIARLVHPANAATRLCVRALLMAAAVAATVAPLLVLWSAAANFPACSIFGI